VAVAQEAQILEKIFARHAQAPSRNHLDDRTAEAALLALHNAMHSLHQHVQHVCPNWISTGAQQPPPPPSQPILEPARHTAAVLKLTQLLEESNADALEFFDQCKDQLGLSTPQLDQITYLLEQYDFDGARALVAHIFFEIFAET
jgi:hypothetical protein